MRPGLYSKGSDGGQLYSQLQGAVGTGRLRQEGEIMGTLADNPDVT